MRLDRTLTSKGRSRWKIPHHRLAPKKTVENRYHPKSKSDQLMIHLQIITCQLKTSIANPNNLDQENGCFYGRKCFYDLSHINKFHFIGRLC